MLAPRTGVTFSSFSKTISHRGARAADAKARGFGKAADWLCESGLPASIMWAKNGRARTETMTKATTKRRMLRMVMPTTMMNSSPGKQMRRLVALFSASFA